MAIIGVNKEAFNGLYFNGKDSHAIIPHKDYLKRLNEFTIDIRVNFRDISNETAGYDWFCLFAKKSYSNSIGLMLSRNKELRFYHAGLSPANTTYTWNDIKLKEWYDIRVTYNGFETKIIIDGVVVKSQSITGTLVENELPIYLGISNGTTNAYPLDGYIGSFKIYNRALRESEKIDVDLIADYSLDNVSGGSITDNSPMGNHATVYNFDLGVKRFVSGLRTDGFTGCVSMPMDIPSFPFSVEITAVRKGKVNGAFTGLIGWRFGTELLRGINLVEGSMDAQICLRDYEATTLSPSGSGVNMELDKEYVIKAEFTGSYIKLYINDILAISASHTPSARVSSEFIIGGVNWGASGGVNRCLDGIVKNAKIYQGDNLTHEYDFENQDITSNTVKDSIGNIDGTIKGGARYTKRLSKKIPKKNLFNRNDVEQGGNSYSNGVDFESSKGETATRCRVKNLVRIRPYTNYILSVPSGYMVGVQQYNYDKKGVRDSGWVSDGYTVKTEGSACHVAFFIKRGNDSVITPNDVKKINIQLEEGLSKTSYEDFSIVNNRVKSAVGVKSSYKNYPFKFLREGTTFYNGSIVSINQPRVTMDGGVIVEEKTTNLINSNDMTNPYYDNTKFKLESLGDFTYKITSLVDSPPTGYHGQFRSSQATLANQNATLSAEVIEVSAPYIAMGCMGFGYLTPNTIEGYSMRRYSLKINHTTNWTHAVGGFYVTANNQSLIKAGDYIIMRYPQIEHKAYSTDFSLGTRERESLFIENGSSLIDTVRGSIELEVTPVNKNGIATSMDYGFHDLMTYSENSNSGFIVRREGSNYQFYTRNSNGLYNQFISASYLLGETIKYRIEWDVSKNTTKFYVNGNLLSTLQTFKIVPNERMYIGCGDNNRGIGNAIYKNLIIRNRYGETVFKL